MLFLHTICHSQKMFQKELLEHCLVLECMKKLVNSMNKWKNYKKHWIVIAKDLLLEKQLILLKELNLNQLSTQKKDGEIGQLVKNKLKMLSIIILKQEVSKKLQKLQFLPNNGQKQSNCYKDNLLKSLDLFIDKLLDIILKLDNKIQLKNIS